MDIMNYGLREKYEQLKKFGDRLSDMKDVIQWDCIKPLLSDLYNNDTEKGGRPNFDPVFMVKIMFLQSLYGLVDEAMEIELYSNIRFMNFLDYPESVPDARTIWLFRERIEAFLFMYFIAMAIQALIERDIRMNMEKRGIVSLPIYPEGRECSSPTAYRLLSLFDNIMLNHIIINGREIKKIHTDLTEVQKQILWLLDITEERFWRDQ